MVIHDEKVERELLRRAEEARRDLEVPPLERLASPLNRLAAFVVDYFVLAWPFAVLTMSPFKRHMQEANLIGDEFSMQVYGLLMALVGLFTLISYQTLFHWIAGATPGKFVFGLRVVALWSRDSRPTFWEALGRSCFWVGQFFLLALPFLAVMADPNRRPWHDRFSNTVVVSVRKKAASMAPNIYEIALVRVCMWTVAGFAMVGGLVLGLREYHNAKRSYEFSQRLGGSSGECEAVDQALEDWPLEKGEAPSRLSVAMALFATGDLDKSCLRAEVENPLSLIENRPLAYLAKSFVYSDNQEISDEYLNEICKLDSQSDECHLARVIEGMAEENTELVYQEFSKLNQDSRVYLSLWAIRQFIRMQDFASAAQYIDNIPAHSSLAYFMIPARAKIYWGLHRREESRAIASAALDLLNGDDKLQFASWHCFAELNDACSGATSSSCRVFSRLNEKIDGALNDFQPALTRLKIGDCVPEKKVTDLMAMDMHPDVRQYAELMIEKNLRDLHEYWQDSETRYELKDEVAQQILKLTSERKYIDPIRNDWLSRSRGLAWERLGRELFSKDVATKNWAAALKVGEKLMQFVPSSAGAAYNRLPASVDSLADKVAEVRKMLEKQK